MSGHLRFGFAAFLVAAFSTPAASNSITDLFSPNPAPVATAAVPAPAPEACLRQPGPADSGGHWVYRYDGHRKCWFEAAEDGAVARKAARHVARQPVAAPEEDASAPRRQKAVEDARAELVNSAPAQASEPAPPEPTVKVVHTVPVRLTDAAGPVPPAAVRAEPVLTESVLAKSALAKSGADQLTPDQPAPRRVDVEALLAQAPAAGGEVAAAPPATPIAAPTAKTGGGEGGTASWLGVLLMALGSAALLGSSRTLRRAVWPVRFPDSRTELPVIAHDGRDEPSFGPERIRSASAGRDELLVYDPQSTAALVRTARARRPLAQGLSSQEAF
jgi:hypothetical protein